MDERIYGGIAALLGAITGYFFGGWTAMMNALLVFVIIDYLTGWAAAWMRGELRSMKGYVGIAKKVGIFLLVTVAHLIDSVLGDMHYLRDAVVFFYIVNELLSIIENYGKMGFKVPDALVKAVAVLQEKASGEARKDENGRSSGETPDPQDKAV
ncbi:MULTISPECIES: phage holin family protein [Paenibacillus]|uniref:phage holin family protein n=1 Tax=Paenibacillus TaxID=44249 RepID=UPI0011A6ED6B|nr:phage holin family protein [Paenibacillus sp. IHBB 10380]